MKEKYQYILEKYLMVVGALHVFSLGFIVIAPLAALSDGNYLLALILAIVIYPCTVLLTIDSFRKD